MWFLNRGQLLSLSKKLSVGIPDAWTRETLADKNNNDAETNIFADRRPEFAPSVMIKSEDDNGENFDSIKDSYMKKIYGKNIEQAVEQPILHKYLDPAASKKYVVFGPNFLTGNAFLCLLHYPDIKKTVVVIFTLIYVNGFTDDEWFYIISNSSNILVSVRRL